MNWDAIAAVGRVLGSIAVFVTLGYLAVQVRQAQRQMRRSVAEARVTAARQLMLTQITDDRLMHIFQKTADPNSDSEGVAALANAIGLTYAEAVTFNVWQIAWWQYRAHVISEIDELPSGERTAFDSALRLNYQIWPGSSLWYKAFKTTGALNPDAVRYVDTVLARPT